MTDESEIDLNDPHTKAIVEMLSRIEADIRGGQKRVTFSECDLNASVTAHALMDVLAVAHMELDLCDGAEAHAVAHVLAMVIEGYESLIDRVRLAGRIADQAVLNANRAGRLP